MTREGRRKRQRAWQMGQDIAKTMDWETGHAAEWDHFDLDEQVEFLRGVAQHFSAKAHELATQETDA
jgi:hypothetical protein